MNEYTAHGMMIGVCLLAFLGLLLSHIEVLWGQARDFLQRNWDEWIRITGW